MVAQGWALAYRQYSTSYVGQENAAHAAGLGIWRRVHRAVGLEARPADADGHREGRAAGVGGRMMQGLHYRQGMRQQLHQPVEDLPQGAGVRVRCAVTIPQLAVPGRAIAGRSDGLGLAK
jgi:hypothetical protein